MSDELELTCCIGGSGARLFKVQIPMTRSVECLKELIKSKHRNIFEHVDALDLVIWKLIRKVEWSKDVYALKEVIKAGSSELSNVLAQELILWKASIPTKSNEDLKSFTPIDEDALDSIAALNDVFPDIPQQGHVHIMIKYPSPSQRRFRDQRHSCLAQLRAYIPPPSIAVRSSSLVSIQRDILTQGTIACHRPQTMQVTPISLLDPVFGKLEDDMQNLQPNWKDFTFARELNAEMSQFYKKEDLYITKLQRIFKEHGLPIYRKVVGKSATVSDSDRGHHSLQLILTSAENKSHASFFDVLFSYVRNLIHTYNTMPELRNTPLPAVLLFYDGNVGSFFDLTPLNFIQVAFSELRVCFSPPEFIVNSWALSYPSSGTSVLMDSVCNLLVHLVASRTL
ncbi:hypothetical protein AMATHDRAFT_50115 [Amanita thiersii Skay4041]|uniref:Crinkler effector protein N-terminal domain-containing protein n=1 Tax=Amanita thiersii Skay4041 TaxID=703135 RepID=A0A2A9NJ11_9AGAR|nr:hypothetical protein AMATHDRAFT_50115 [Amanita thiersii Skay4041]